jgi:hypothetical protein
MADKIRAWTLGWSGFVAATSKNAEISPKKVG